MCILIPLLVGLISALLGYLLGRLLGGGNNNDDEWKSKVARLQADLDACRASKTELQANLDASASRGADFASSFAAPVAAFTAVAFDAAAAKAVFGKKIKENDLTVVEGIGPKIKELFHNHNVTTWAGLAECTLEKCQQVLDSGGERFNIHNPGTWPEQARLAAEGKWKKLFDWQEELDGGK